MQRKLIVLFLLSVLVIAVGIALPGYIRRDHPPLIGGPFHTPRPTSTRFTEPLAEIVEAVEVEEPQPETSNEATNCTYPLYYWKEYPYTWPEQIIIGDQIYTREDVLEIFNAEDPDTARLLIQQMYTAFLNILGGANYASIEASIVDANNWLKANPPGAAISELNQQIGLYLTAELENYNNGMNGPPACDDVPPPPTPSPPITAALTPTPTSTPALPTPRVLPPSFRQLPANTQPAPPGSPSQPTATAALPTATPTSALRVTIPTAINISPTLLPTFTPTRTPTSLPPTRTPTPPPPTNTPTPLPPTRTPTPLPPTNTPTPLPPTSTPTPLPPTNTPTPLPPTSTPTPLPPTSTPTPLPPTSTPTDPPPTPTDTPVPNPTDTPVPTPTDTPTLDFGDSA